MKKFILPAVATAVLVGGVALVAITSETAVATVNGVKITSEEVDKHFSQIPANLIEGKEEEFRKNILERLVEQELVLQDAKTSGVYENSEFQNQLKLMTENLAYNFTIQTAVNKELTDELLKSEYEGLKDSFKHAVVHARHILVKEEAEAIALVAELDAGKDFAELAKEKSIGPSKENGGDLGYFKQQDMVKPFADVAFSMEPGTYSKTPVNTQFGWHVIKVEDKKWSKEPTFEELEQNLRQSLTQGIMKKYISNLRTNAKVDYAG